MSVIAAYREKANSGLLEFDKDQAQAAEILTALQLRLKNYRPDAFRLFSSREPAPQGVFIYGKVGRGKSMLMDLFYENTDFAKKRRVHFHEFMAEVHNEINIWRKLSHNERKKQPHFVKDAGDDPIAPVAQKIINEARLLCFDEFQITDIADAMILGRLFDALWARDCIIIATSNRHPKDQYQNGLNRQIVLPFLARLEKELEIHSLDSNRDYRLERLEKEARYFSPLGNDAQEFARRAWDRLTFAAIPISQKILVEGRETIINRTAAGMAWFDFNDLCGDYSNNQSPLGVRDYLEIARVFNTIIIENVPKLGKDKANEAARFRNLIDALYEAKAKLILTLACDLKELYSEGTQSFEFERTISRLHEMQSHEYLAMAHCS